MTRILLSIACLISCGIGVAQDLVITNARIIDGTGATIDRGSVVVADGRITSVLEGDTDAPGDRIDARNMSVMPGMIDTHVHLLSGRSESQAALDEFIEQRLPGGLSEYLERGFTTLLSTGDATDAILSVRQSVRDGTLRGPRLLASGAIFTAPGGHPAATVCGDNSFCLETFVVEAADTETARQEVRRLAEAGVDVIKAVYGAQPGLPILEDDVFEAIADEASSQDLPFVVHINGDTAIRALELGANRFVHPPIRRAEDLSEISRKLSETPIPFATTVQRYIQNPRPAELEVDLAGIRRLWADGHSIVFGTDRPPGRAPSEAISNEIGALARVLSSAEIIDALTRKAAEFLYLDDEIGTLEPGKVADMVIIDANPLEDIAMLERVAVVIQGGRIVVDNR